MRWTPNRIRKLRENLGYTKAEFADLIGVNKSQMTRYESGETAATPMLERLLDYISRDHEQGRRPLHEAEE